MVKELKPRCFYPKVRKFCHSNILYRECSRNRKYPTFEDRPCKDKSIERIILLQDLQQKLAFVGFDKLELTNLKFLKHEVEEEILKIQEKNTKLSKREELENKARVYKYLSEFFKVLANPDRLAILQLLSQEKEEETK